MRGSRDHKYPTCSPSLSRPGILEEQEVRVGGLANFASSNHANGSGKTGNHERPSARGSVAHEYWKRLYAEMLKSREYQVELEAPRPGGTGRVDALARRGTESLVVEVETGKSDVVGNVKQNLRAGFPRILVVATDEAALKKAEPKLAKAGLIIPGRVEIVLGNSRNKFSVPAVSDAFGADS